MIRPKLMLAFAAMSVMTAICGAVGLAYVERIWDSQSVFANATSPLLTESMALVDNAQRMRAAYGLGTARLDNIDETARRIEQLQNAGAAHLDALRRLASQPGIALDLAATESRRREFVQLLQRMLASHRRELTAAASVRDRLQRFSDRRHQLDTDLDAVANRAQGEINRSEERAKVQVQTGTATIDGLGDILSGLLTETFPLVHSATRLLQESEQLAEIAKTLLAQTAQAPVASLENDTRNAFKTMTAVSGRLASRMRDAQGRPVADRIRGDIAALDVAMLGPDGLFAGQRNVLAAQTEITEARNALFQAEAQYLGVLDDVLKAVNTLNQQARDRASNDVGRARTVVAATVLLTLLAALGLGALLAQRLSAPLIRLADHAAVVGGSGELKPLGDAAVIGRSDEIGALARALNLMMGELGDARQRLIAWSETAIRLQFERLTAAINNMSQGLCMFDSEQRLIVCNQRYADIYRLDPALTEPGTSLRVLLEDHIAKGTSPVGGDNFVESRLAAVAQHKPYYHVSELRDGHIIAISHQPMANGGSVATHEDITERRQIEARVAYMAHHDTLTDLPNRVSFHEAMDRALHQVARGGSLAVLCIDLDNFKAVNDTLGHPVGDALLQAVADRIRDYVRPTDTVARLGGDEFAIVQLMGEQPNGSTALAARLIKGLSEPFDVKGHQVVIGASVGIALAPSDGTDPDQLMRNADMAMYRAKEDGRSTYRFFEPEMDARMQSRRTLELELRKAVVLKTFEVFYQPTINLRTQQVSGFEALLRWRHPERGLVAPGEFIPLAEEIGLIGQIGAWVLKQACRDAMQWPDSINVAVNLSPLQFKGGSIVLDVVAALGESGLPAHRLELEITEAVLLQDTETTVATLNQLRELGIHIAMDDFGTGYSSLGYLRKFPFDKIKIDRSFIHDMTEKPDSVAIVRAVTGLGSTLGIATTAEGVETAEQLHQLEAEGCTEVQGFLFSKPVPAKELDTLLRRLTPAPKAVA